jgi:hypothetical protein
LFFHPGWKLQYEIAQNQGKAEDEDDAIFYGLGNCPYKKASPDMIKPSATVDELIEFYMTVMRTECLAESRTYLKSLVEKGYLAKNDTHLMVPKTHKLL